MLPWIMKRRGIDQAEEFAKIRERGSWSQNGRGRWSIPPFFPPRSCGRSIVLVLLLALAVGCATARAVYQHVSASKLAHAEDVIRELAAEEGWSDERLEILLANLHRKYREE